MAIITGAGTGIGEAIAHKFAREGASVIVELPDDRIEDMVQAIGKGRCCRIVDTLTSTRKNSSIDCIKSSYDYTSTTLSLLSRNRPGKKW